MADIEEIIDNFSTLDVWDDRYRYLIELGRELPPLAPGARSDANKVSGCASQVWLDTIVQPSGASGPVLAFAGDSDAHIVRGTHCNTVRHIFQQARERHPFDRCAFIVRTDGTTRAPHTAAVKRLPLDG